MKIIIDASRALHSQPTGIEVYSQAIIQGLLALPQAKDHVWELLTPELPQATHPLAQLPSFATWRSLPGRRLWTLFQLSRYFAQNPELRDATLFVPGHVLPYIAPKQTVITLHDFAFRYYPQFYGFLASQRMNWELSRSARKATQIIVPSKATRDDVVRFYAIAKAKISVIPHGIDQTLYQPKTAPPLEAPYFLFYGRRDGRKNLGRLMAAYVEALTTNPHLPDLVILGAAGSMRPDVVTLLAHLDAPIRQKIHICGFVNQAELLNWLQSAFAFVFPSLYEGFGFPVLEAMACGIPVITSSTSSLSEVAGDAALLVDPTNQAALAKALLRLAGDAADRQKYRELGQKHVRQYTWQRAAEATFAVLTNTDHVRAF